MTLPFFLLIMSGFAAGNYILSVNAVDAVLKASVRNINVSAMSIESGIDGVGVEVNQAELDQKIEQAATEAGSRVERYISTDGNAKNAYKLRLAYYEVSIDTESGAMRGSPREVGDASAGNYEASDELYDAILKYTEANQTDSGKYVYAVPTATYGMPNTNQYEEKAIVLGVTLTIRNEAMGYGTWLAQTGPYVITKVEPLRRGL